VELIYSIFIIHIHVACEQNLYNYQRLQSKLLCQPPLLSERHCGRDRMVVGFTTTYEISAYHHWCCELESHSGEVYSIQH